MTSIAGSSILLSKIHDCVDDKLVYNSDSKFYMMRSKYDSTYGKSGVCRVIFLEKLPGQTVKRQAIPTLHSYDISVRP